MVFLYVLMIIFFLILILVTSKLRIDIDNIRFSTKEDKKINDDFIIKIKLLVLFKIPLINIKITNDKIKNMNVKEKIKNKIKKIDISKVLNKYKENKKSLNIIKIEAKNIDLNIGVGIGDAMLNSMVIPVIASFVSIILKESIINNSKPLFTIYPIYNQNILNIRLTGIFEIKIVNIISMIYVFIKKGKVNNYEHSSNRRPYEFSYEQY